VSTVVLLLVCPAGGHATVPGRSVGRHEPGSGDSPVGACPSVPDGGERGRNTRPGVWSAGADPYAVAASPPGGAVDAGGRIGGPAPSSCWRERSAVAR